MEKPDENIDLGKILKILKKHIRLIIFFLAFGAITAASVTSIFMKPMYQVKTQLIVRPATKPSGQIDIPDIQDIQGNIQLVNTYNDIIVSPAILNEVIHSLKLDMTSSTLRNQVKLSTEMNSQVITMYVQNNNPTLARNIANRTVDIFKKEIVKIMNVDNIAVLAPAEVNKNIKPISPNRSINLVFGLLCGLITGVSIACYLEFTDKTVKSSREVEQLVNLTVVGEIPYITSEDMKESK